MAKMLRLRFVLLAVISVLFAASSVAEDIDTPWLVSKQMFADTELEIVWQSKLPMRETETLERLIILGNRIYALSDHNYMVSINREQGNVIFSRPIDEAGLPVVGLGLYEQELFSIVGNELVEINAQLGTDTSRKSLEFGVFYPAARNSLHFYIAGGDRRIHALRVRDKVQAFEVAADNDSEIVSIFADEESVIFATKAGNCVSIKPDGPKKLWQIDAADAIVGPIIKDDGSVFIASKDTNVYKINAADGKLVWKYSAGAILDRAPRVSRAVVYQYLGDKGLVAIDRKNGKALWRLAEGVDLLAEHNGKAYVITKAETLIVMDNKKRKKLRTVNLAGVSKYIANTADSKIYIADEQGRIACLKPIE